MFLNLKATRETESLSLRIPIFDVFPQYFAGNQRDSRSLTLARPLLARNAEQFVGTGLKLSEWHFRVTFRSRDQSFGGLARDNMRARPTIGQYATRDGHDPEQ
jgi:hypothetical protein